MMIIVSSEEQAIAEGDRKTKLNAVGQVSYWPPNSKSPKSLPISIMALRSVAMFNKLDPISL